MDMTAPLDLSILTIFAIIIPLKAFYQSSFRIFVIFIIEGSAMICSLWASCQCSYSIRLSRQLRSKRNPDEPIILIDISLFDAVSNECVPIFYRSFITSICANNLHVAMCQCHIARFIRRHLVSTSTYP